MALSLVLKLFLFLSSFNCFLEIVEAKVWTKCTFLTELRKQNVTDDLLATWLCIAEKESNLNSSLKLTQDGTGNLLTDCKNSSGFGVFQIPSLWCMDDDIPDEECQTQGCTDRNCNEYLDDDLSNDIECVSKIHEIYLFENWPPKTQTDCEKSDKFIDVDEICRQENYKSPYAPALIISVTVSVVVILVASLIWKQWSKAIRLTSEEYRNFKYGMKSEENFDQEGEYVYDITMQPYDQTFEIPATDYELKTRLILGQGQYGFVFKGIVRQENVAVKSVKPHSDKHYLLSLLSEIKIMIYLGKHEHVLELIGAATKHLRRGLVYAFMEYCELGNLQDFLRARRDTFVNQIKNDRFVPDLPQKHESIEMISPEESELPISTKDLVLWSYQICKGMEYIMSRNVYHGDLASRNCLLFDRNCIKISDFGLAGKIYNYTHKKKKNEEGPGGPMPWRWMSIESLRDWKFSIQSDLWSAGVTLWEIFSLGDLPYTGLEWVPNFVSLLLHGLRLQQPLFCTTELFETIIVHCWDQKPEQRISFVEMGLYFNKILATVSLDGRYETMGSMPESAEDKTNYLKKRNTIVSNSPDDNTTL